MKVFRSLSEFNDVRNPVATIGTFDGVHLGHQKILNRVIASARELEGESVLISFHPHPRLVLFPEDNPLRMLQTVEEKIDKLEQIGIDVLLLLPFTREFSRIPSETFIEDILVKGVGIRKIIVGYDHQFGKNRTGGLSELVAGSEKFGYEVEEIPAEQIDNANISSTKIRNALAAGEIETANQFLGSPFLLTGKVIKGDQLGRQLGYPTANLDLGDQVKLIPKNGVYLVSVKGQDLHKYGMMNIGFRPTVTDTPELRLEVNLFNFDGDLYEQTLHVSILNHIREEHQFDSLETLKTQIARDEANCKQLIQQRTYESA